MAVAKAFQPPSRQPMVAAFSNIVTPSEDDVGTDMDPKAVALMQALTTKRILENEDRLQAEIEAVGNDVCNDAEPTVLKPIAPHRENANRVDVRVNTLNGLLCEISAERSWTVDQVKAKVARAAKIPRDEQRLFLGDCELEDSAVLKDITPPSSPSADVALVRQDPEQLRWRGMLEVSGMQLAVATPEMRAQRDLVLRAVKNNGRALQFAADELRSDADVVKVAVYSNGLALEYAKADLHADRDLVLVAVQQDGQALQFVADFLRRDKDVVMIAAKTTYGAAFAYADETLRCDREFVLQVLTQASGLAFEFAAHMLRTDKEVALVAVKENGLALEFASEELRSDREVILEAVKMNGLALWDAADEFRCDPIFLAAARWQK